MTELVKLIGLVGMAVLFKHYDRPPLQPWDRVGSGAYVYIVNEDADTLRVMASALDVDGAMRYLGAVPPHGEAAFKLPYADTRVMLYAPIGEVEAMRPGVWRITWR